MPTITPHLWFDKEAKEAAEFYTSLKLSLFLYRAKRKQKSITTGRSCLLIHKRNNVAG